MFKFLKHNFLNFFWYYRVRDVDIQHFTHDTNFKEMLTNIMLNSVGLMISDKPISKYIYLSEIQRKSINKANLYGYKVGLLTKKS